MQSSKTYSPNQSLGIVLQGGAGMGKTTFALQFPRPYIFDADNNLAGAFRRLSEKNITFAYDIGNIDENNAIVPEPLRYTRMTKCITAAFSSPDIDTVILDSASAVSDYIIADILRQTGKPNLVMQDWGVYLNAWKKLITACRSQSKTFILTAHDKLEKDEMDGSITYELALPGQISARLSSMMSDVWHFEVQSGTVNNAPVNQYVVRTQPTSKLKLKSSFPTLPNLFSSADFTKVTSALAPTGM